MSTISPELAGIIQREMALGNYESEEAFLRAAVQSLISDRESQEAIERGREDVKAGRSRPWRDAVDDLRARHNLPPRS